jgi:hypothetical protein
LIKLAKVIEFKVLNKDSFTLSQTFFERHFFDFWQAEHPTGDIFPSRTSTISATVMDFNGFAK